MELIHKSFCYVTAVLRGAPQYTGSLDLSSKTAVALTYLHS